jgi:hypothetical protein
VASVNDRWWTLQSDGSKKHSERFGTGMRWQVRYRNVQGQSRNKSFERKSDAEDFMASISVDLNRGLYIDPKTGKRNFDIYSDQWLSQSMVDVSTKVQRELHVRLHMKPFWLKREIGTIRPSDVQEWIIWLSNKGMSPKSVKLIHSNFRIIMQDISAQKPAALLESLDGRPSAMPAGCTSPECACNGFDRRYLRTKAR